MALAEMEKKKLNRADRSIELKEKQAGVKNLELRNDQFAVENERRRLENERIVVETERLRLQNVYRRLENWRVRVDLFLRIAVCVAIVTGVGYWYHRVLEIADRQQSADQSLRLSDAVMIALFGTTTATVVGLAATVARYLFPVRPSQLDAEPAGEAQKP